mgnify:CR=1 FL=1
MLKYFLSLKNYKIKIKESELKMSITGIISEYNPFHNGHKYLIQNIKKIFLTAISSLL